MKCLKIALFLSVFFLLGLKGNTQTLFQPAIGSKTHPSMSIDSLVKEKDQTRIYIQVENQSTEGNAWFCADKDISLIEKSNGKVHQLIRSVGIPVCPEQYTFSYPGEKLYFTLVFPGLSHSDGEIDIIENCSDHCFSLKNVVLDEALNLEIRLFESGVELYRQGNFNESLNVFEFLSSSDFKQENHYAYSLYIIPVLYQKLEKYKQAESAYRILKTSSINEKDYFMDKIHEIDFFRKLKE